MFAAFFETWKNGMLIKKNTVIVLALSASLFAVSCKREAPPSGEASTSESAQASPVAPERVAPARSTEAPSATPASPDTVTRPSAADNPVQPVERAARAGDNVLLITLDTTRADYLGCYGRKEAVTPALDELAKRGTLFEQAFSQVPVTLPSHASILTGKYPRQHGVSDNGRERLAGDQVTLAQLARDHGYKTAAFVATYVLDSRFGLADGFDTYNDDMGTHDRSIEPTHWEQPADVVTDRALEWLESVKSGPFFGWVHYYDAHDPYAPPEAFKNVGANPYDGEIAFIDSQVRRLADWLAQTNLDRHTLVVVVGDHGESFGEHKEVGHTVFLYDTNIHVPLIVAGPAAVKQGQRIETVVETVDLFPTVAALLNWDVPADVSGRSLVPALQGGSLDPHAAYSESLYGLHAYGWCEQRSLIAGAWKYISSVKPELYDRKSDPGEQTNLLEAQPDRAREMAESLRARFAAMPAGKADVMDFDRRARETLTSLGYVGGGGLSSDEFLTTDYSDPKDELDVVNLVMAGRRAVHVGNHRLSMFHFYNASLRAPNSFLIQWSLGSALLNVYDQEAEQANGVGDFELLDKALAALAKAVELDPMNEGCMAAIGDVYLRQRHFEKAAEQYERVLEGQSPYPEIHVKLASALRQAGKPEEARAQLEKAIELDPSLADAQYNLGVYYLDRNNPNQALPYLHNAVRFNPKNKNYQYNLALALYQLDQFEGAVEQFKIAVELDEDFKDAVINLGVAQFQAGQLGPAQATLMHASEKPLMAVEAYYNLGVIMEHQGQPGMAMDFYQRSFTLRPGFMPVVTKLTQWFLAKNQTGKAVDVLRKALAARPDDVALLNTLAGLLATSNDDAVRAGSEAVTLAEHASALTGGTHPDVLRTLAMAYAESGDFEKAVATAGSAIQYARAAGREPFATRIEADREAYLKGQPVRSDQP